MPCILYYKCKHTHTHKHPHVHTAYKFIWLQKVTIIPILHSVTDKCKAILQIYNRLKVKHRKQKQQ